MPRTRPNALEKSEPKKVGSGRSYSCRIRLMGGSAEVRVLSLEETRDDDDARLLSRVVWLSGVESSLSSRGRFSDILLRLERSNSAWPDLAQR
jgi:hypothetical protein